MIPAEVFLTFILMLSIFLGFELINKVPATLHTPLMSGANAISGITRGRCGRPRRNRDRSTPTCPSGWALAAVASCLHQRGGRLPGNRPHARHVQEEGGLRRHG